LTALIRGASADAVRVFSRMLDLCKAYDLDAYVSRIMAALGCAKARAGEVDDGLLLLQEAVALDSAAETADHPHIRAHGAVGSGLPGGRP